MSLATELSSVTNNFEKHGSKEVVETVKSVKSDFKASYDPDSAIKVGAKLPAFSLPDVHGKQVNSNELLAAGPLLITFYRGDWCPFCNLALRAMQRHIDEFNARRVTFVAISPELPDTSLSTAQKNSLQFPVLSDPGNNYAKQLGILFQQPDALRPVFEHFGHDLKRRNGDDSFAVPIPASFLVDQTGTLCNRYLDADWTKRLEPSTALGWIDELQK